MVFGLSQLQALDERSEGTIVPADATIYWEEATKIKKAVADELTKVKVVGRGGTKYAYFSPMMSRTLVIVTSSLSSRTDSSWTLT